MSGAVLTPEQGSLPGRDAGWPARIVSALRRDLPLAGIDLCAAFGAYLVPLVLRFGGEVPPRYWGAFWTFGSLAVLVHVLANYLFGLYGQMWRFASVLEARRLLLAGLSAGTLIVVSDLLAPGLRPLPISVVGLGAVLSVGAFGAVRFQSRLFGFRRRAAGQAARRVLVVGAGEAGAMVLQDMLENPSVGLDPVGLIDDDPHKRGIALRGVRVLGNRASLPKLVRRLGVDEVLLAIPSATGAVVRDLAALCEEAEVPLRVLPSRRDLVSGRVTVRDVRDLRIEDLLGRRQVESDLTTVAAMVRGRRVLVTGAGGSIGSEIARQVADLEPRALTLLDHDETHLHDVLVDLAAAGSARAVLADVRDRERMLDTFGRCRPEVVFHAAAHKHVPLLEAHPEEALATNVLGTAHVADAAAACGTRRFVLVSTDKAVNAASVMGASKWFAEQIVRSLDGTCVFCCVRFGNVLGSRGSVIPTFIRQIQHGGPVTVTDPEMARYFMSVQEAVQLVLQAGALSAGGEVFTLEMGAPVNILDLARRLIRLTGRVPGRDVPVQLVGRRPGEKLVEDVVALDEDLGPTVYPGIRVSHPLPPDPAWLRSAIHELEGLAAAGQGELLAAQMKQWAARLPVPLAVGGRA